ncbi:MAG: hypothetical protein R2712_04660 [Vicinamibacterales bacterium]
MPVRHFEAAIELDPATTPAYLNLGDARLLDGDAARAQEAWHQLADATPDRAHLALDRLERLFEQHGTPQRFETTAVASSWITPS